MINRPLRWLSTVLCLVCSCAAMQPGRESGHRAGDGGGGHFEVTEATITETLAALREHRVTCRELVERHLARIRAYDQTSGLNALVVLNPRALDDADALDREIAHTGRLRPLHGVTVIVKDNYDTQGLQTTAGSLALRGFQPAADATMVRKLRDAGAIVLAKSNMAEWAFSPYVTMSSIAGVTRNPYDLERVPAGSSGGTAAAVAASLGAIGLGTDTGNSIRGPSSHTALVGIRPTMGLTSRAGIVPLFLGNDVGGPMARSVADAAALLGAVAGPDDADAVTRRSAGKVEADYTRFLRGDALKGARIGVFRRYLDAAGGDPEVKALAERALADLAAAGATLVDPFDVPNFDGLTRDIWCGDFQADVNGYLAAHANAPYRTLAAIVDTGLFLPYVRDRLLGALQRADGSARRCGDPYVDPRKIALRDALVVAMAQARVDAVVYPTWSNPPRKIGDTESEPGDNSQILSPQTGFPAITVPMGMTHGTLPAGLTFLGRLFAEPTLIGYAYAYEQATRHRRPPPRFPPLAF